MAREAAFAATTMEERSRFQIFKNNFLRNIQNSTNQ